MDDVERGTEEVPEDNGEQQLGTSTRGASANAVILALTRAARSFLLYDPSNEAIRHFLQALKDAVEAYTSHHGDLPLAVRPFELAVDGETVYVDRDRERSLAFRLYRDGVRRITAESSVPWHEVLKLLEVLSIRYTGIRQTEDDMVVLLWKAGFQHIQIDAVEGFVPVEEVRDDEASVGYGGGGGGGGAGGGGGQHVEAPPDFDLPAPNLRVVGPVRHRAIDPKARDALLAEDSTQEIPELCLKLVDQLLVLVANPMDPLPFGEVSAQLKEVRDFLLTEGHLSVVLAMVRRLTGVPLDDDAARERDGLVASFADERALGRLIHGVPRDIKEAPAEMVTLLDAIPGNHLQALVAILDRESIEASRRVARSLVERYLGRDAAWVIARIVDGGPHLASELLRAVARVDLDRAIEAIAESHSRDDLDFQLEAMHALSRAPVSPALVKVLVAYLGAANEDIRLRTLDLVGRRAVRAAYQPIVDRVRRDALLRLTPRDAEASGEALARCDPGRALETFRDWIRPKGFFGGGLASPMLQWTAVAGLVHIPSEESEALIKYAAERGGSELQKHCTASMVKRRRLARGAKG